MQPALILAAVLATVLVGCAQGGGQANPTLGATPPAGEENAPAEGDAITGKLGGDPTLEGGCGWVDDGSTRWNVQYPDEYELSLDPVRLTGPDGETAEEGDTITVTGSEAADVMTTCQIGPVWVATSVEFSK